MVLEEEGFYISFNPSLTHLLGHSFAPDTDKGETALVKPNDKRKFRILNGDFRKDYEKLVPLGFTACRKFFEKKEKKYNSSWSS